MTINKRFAIILALASGLAGAAAGYRLGIEAGAGRNLPGLGPQSAAAPAAAAAPRADARNGSEVAEVEAWRGWLQNGRWYELEQWLDQSGGELDEAGRRTLVKGLRERINKYDAVMMRRVVRSHLHWFPQDVEARFLLSDLQQVEGLAESALETLFDLLNGGFGPQVDQRARVDADRIINSISAGLKNRGALAELEAFWRHVSQRYPRSDFYRYQWALALAELQRWQEAGRVLAETGASDVAQATLDELSAKLEAGARGLNFERRGDRLLASVRSERGEEYKLLVDTGANITSFSRQALRGLRAVPAGAKVQVQTAGGLVEASVYWVSYLEVEGRELKDLRVLQLPAEIPGMDGLLGTDVLKRLNWSVDNL